MKSSRPGPKLVPDRALRWRRPPHPGFASRIWRNIPRFFHVDLNHDPAKSLVLASTGRTGSTWVADLLNCNHDFRLIYEPLTPGRVPMVAHFKWGQRIPPEGGSATLTEPVRNILSGRIRNAWADQYNRRLFADRRLIKFIRANLMLGWIRRSFPETPIILLFRHPCAVAHSMLRLRNWEWNLDGFRDQPALFKEILRPFEPIITPDLPPFERHIMNWCIEYLIPMKELAAGDFFPLFYEDLCLNGETVARQLFDFAGVTFTPAALQALATPSGVTRQKSAIRTGEDLVTAWRNHIAPGQVARAYEILRAFNLDGLYPPEGFPDKSALDHLLASNRTP